MKRVLYLCPDTDEPSGGVRVIYNHVEHLLEEGIDARVVHFKRGFLPTWFKVQVPVSDDWADLKPSENDWVVIPEVFLPNLDRIDPLPSKRILFCQNHFFLFDALPIGTHLDDFGFVDYLTSSMEISNCLNSVFDVRGTCVPCSLDHQLFKSDDKPPRIQVAFMPRRGNLHIKMAISIVRNRNPDLCIVPWIAIDGVSEEEAARILKSSAVYVATGYREGLGLPSLEAMACGCVVAGFKAGGGRDYATAKNGFWVGDEDALALGLALEKCLTQLLENFDHPDLKRMRKEAQKTALLYNQESQKEALLKFWNEKL